LTILTPLACSRENAETELKNKLRSDILNDINNEPSSANNTYIHWKTFSSTDAMTGKTSYFASSAGSRPEKTMSMPYDDTIANLVVACDKNSEWAYLNFNNTPNIIDTDIGDGYNIIKTRIKWDEKISSVSFTQTWGGSSIFFPKSTIANTINNIVTSKELLVQLNWYGNTNTYFKFNLQEGAYSVSKIRQDCKLLK
jgi:hypothetical protein